MDRVNKSSICHESLRELDDYFIGRSKDIKRGAETPAIAGLMFEKFAWGLSNGLKYLDKVLIERPSISAVIQTKADELVLELDPSYKENKQKRWNSRPADLSFNTPIES